MIQKTALHNLHQNLGAKFVDFGNWDMPIRYDSVIAEHLAVRNKTGIFDVSHMGNFTLKGPDTKKAINQLISNDVDKISPGQAMYSPLLYENGTFVDDIIVYYISDDDFNIIVNAANIDKDFDWMKSKIDELGFQCELKNISNQYSLVAIQGKESSSLIQKVFPHHDLSTPFQFAFSDYEESKLMIANTGYTGESGVEILVGNECAEKLFQSFIDLGATPCGLAARDSLRLEKGYSLYGHEITDKTNALESGLGWAVSFNKDFIGKKALEEIKESGLKRRLVGFVMEDKGIPRNDFSVHDLDGEEIGYVTSGGYSPSLKNNIGLAYVPKLFKEKTIQIKIKDSLLKAQVHKRVFV